MLQKKRSAGENRQQIGNLFERYKQLLKPPQASVEKECLRAVQAVTGFELKPEQVKYQVNSRTISFIVPSILKSELKPRYNEILSEMRKNLSESSCPNNIL